MDSERQAEHRADCDHRRPPQSAYSRAKVAPQESRHRCPRLLAVWAKVSLSISRGRQRLLRSVCHVGFTQVDSGSLGKVGKYRGIGGPISGPSPTTSMCGLRVGRRTRRPYPPRGARAGLPGTCVRAGVLSCQDRGDPRTSRTMGNAEAAPTIPRHFDGPRFFNPGAAAPRGFPDVLRWRLTSRPDPSPRFVADVEPIRPPTQVDGLELRTTMVNHATVLLQHDGWNMLTDPMWSQRASPVSWAGPHRRRAPGVRLEDLPRIDAVILSHNHYDHLDVPTLRWLIAQRNPTFVAPSRVGDLLRSIGAAAVHELDWVRVVPSGARASPP
jgi:hypothetical protein